MGNVITGAALRKGMKVKQYAMCNAAMSSNAYDNSANLVEGYAFKTPDTDDDEAFRKKYGLANKFSKEAFPNPPDRIHNFYLPKDDALDTWKWNNKIFKPQHGKLSLIRFRPDYGYNNEPDKDEWKLTMTPGPWQAFTQLEGGEMDETPDPLDISTFKTSEETCMAYVTFSRTKPAGADENVKGSINGSRVDMTAWFGKMHSAEWRLNHQKTKPFWTALVKAFEKFK